MVNYFLRGREGWIVIIKTPKIQKEKPHTVTRPTRWQAACSTRMEIYNETSTVTHRGVLDACTPATN